MVKQSIKRMKRENCIDREIAHAFAEDPYINVAEVLSEINQKAKDKFTSRNLLEKMMRLERDMITKVRVTNKNRLP